MSKKVKSSKKNVKLAKTANYKKKTNINVKKDVVNSNLKNARKEHFDSTKTGKVVNVAKEGTANLKKQGSEKFGKAKANFKQRRDLNKQYKREGEKSLAKSNLGIAVIAADTVKDLSNDIKNSEDRTESVLDDVMGQGK